MNQKGQAFSVFELMIAGVVAFAILIVLLTVINGFIFNPQGNAKDSISQTLKGMGISGADTTQSFQMNAGDVLFATNFQSATGYDYQSIYFCVSDKLATATSSKLVVNQPTDGTTASSIKWTGVTKQNFKAKVVCEATSDLINASVDEFTTNACTPGGDASSSYCGTSQPCCAVIFEKG